MKPLRPDALAALEPVRAALHATARAEADERAAAGAAEADEVLAAAHAEAAQIVETAAAEGTSAARAAAALRSARVRREAHELVLTEQEELRKELAAQVVRAAQGLRGDPRHSAWIEHLTRRCREVLGPQATVTPSPSGGVVGELGSRRLDLSVAVLAAATLEAHGAEVRQLWTT